MNIWLDDIRPAPKGWYWVTTRKGAIDALVANQVEWMSFDHDLGIDPAKAEAYNTGEISEHEAEMTGYQVVLWMAENNVWPSEGCFVHSSNPVGAKRICGVVDRYGPYDRPCQWDLT